MVKNGYPRTVHAGPWSAVLESPSRLSNVRLGDVEVLRSLYVAVRDDAWMSVPGVVALVDESFSDESFRVRFHSSHIQDSMDFAWNGSIVGTSDGRIRFELDGTARSAFLANRIGFVALHSLNWAGRACTLVHSDQSESDAKYPSEVSAHQPFHDLSGIRQQLDSGTWVDMRFDGDVFETEDQRNWSDASFKTYSRPLGLPFPVEFPAGAEVRQAVTLCVTAPVVPMIDDRLRQAQTSLKRKQPIIQFQPETHFPWPTIGLGIAPDTELRSAHEDLDSACPSHLRVDVAVSHHGTAGLEDLHRVAALGFPIELAVHILGECIEVLSALAREILNCRAKVVAVYVYDQEAPCTTLDALAAVRAGLADAVSGALFVIGTDDHFAELNRNPVLPHTMGADAVTFSLTPQVHDTTAHAIMETIESIPAMIETARSLSGGAPVAVSPVTLKARRNIHGINPLINRVGRDDGSVDERQKLPFAAAWFLGTLATLVVAGVTRLTFAEVNGSRGLMPAGPHVPSERYPIFYAFEALRGAQEGIVRSLSCTGVVDAVGFVTAEGIRLIVVNLTPEVQSTEVAGVGPTVHLTLSSYEFRVLDYSTAKRKGSTP